MAYQPKSYRKFIATAATATMVAGAVAPLASFAAGDATGIYKDSVNYLLEKGIASGITQDTFGVQQKIKRGDAAIMVAKALGVYGTEAKDAGFKDLNDRIAKAVNPLKEKGIISGKTATEFKPDANITRGEMAIIIAKAYNLKASADVKNPFKDATGIYKDAVTALYGQKIASGVTSDMFGTTSEITRGQFAIFLYNVEHLSTDIEKPEITLTGDKDLLVDFGADFKDPGATAVDKVDGKVEVKSEIKDAAGKVVEKIDTKVAGKYTITYTAVDTAGNKAEATRTVTVSEDPTPVVSSLVASNATDLKVTLAGNVKDKTITEDDFEVKVNGTAVKFTAQKVSDTEYKLVMPVALQGNETVQVNGLADLKGTATTIYKTVEVDKVEAVASTLFTDTDGQFLNVKVNGQEFKASELVAQGYTVNFQATESIFKASSASAVSTTGEVDKAALATLLGANKKSFEYKVTVTKGNSVVSSTNAEVAVYDKTKTAVSAIDKVTIGLYDDATQTTALVSSLTSNKLVVGEYAHVDKAVATLQDGRKNVDLVALSGNLTFSSSDVTVATVETDGTITAKKAGTVTITITSGTAKKDVVLTVVPSTNARTVTTAAVDTTGVKVVNGQSQVTYLTLKDQFGDTVYADATTVGSLSVSDAVSNGKSIASGVLTVATGLEKYGVVELTASGDATNTGTGSLTINTAAGKQVAKVTASVIAATGTPVQQLKANATSIDLNPTSLDSEITFELGKYLNGYYAGSVDMNAAGYKVEVYDADGKQINANATLDPSNTSATIDRDDLVFEGAAASKANLSASNFETGKGLIKVVDANGVIVASTNFNITDSAPTFSAASFANGVEFNTANATTLKLDQLLTSATTTATVFDGVVRYEVKSADTLIAYVEKSAVPNGFTYGTDVYLGEVVATNINANNVTFTDSGTFSDNITINSTAVANKELVQFNVNKRGSETTPTVAKTTVKAVK